MMNIRIYILLFSTVLLYGCGEEFLDMKRNANQVVPKTVNDYLGIVQRNIMLTTPKNLAFLGADEYIIHTEADLTAGSRNTPYHRSAYLWADDVYGHDMNHRDWHEAYEKIMYANLALDVEKLVPDGHERLDWYRTRVAARFYRAWSYYNLAQLFCKVYDPQTASVDLGLPLRMDYDVSVNYSRSTLQEVYDLILEDLHEAEDIPLPIEENIYLPGKIAVFALLGRVYLQMGNYDKALEYAEKLLAERSDLIDYNTISREVKSVHESPFEMYGKGNTSIISYSTCTVAGIMATTRFDVEPIFFESLDLYDLRRKVNFFHNANGHYVYVGSYAGQGGNVLFVGLSVDEIVLIKAECLARLNREGEALEVLNWFRKHRYDRATYRKYEIDEIDHALRLVLDERRKELYMRGLRWEDARRLNREGIYPISFNRVLEGTEYMLEPTSLKWVWPIPLSEVINNDVEQNER